MCAAQAILCLTQAYGQRDVRLARAFASLGAMYAAQGANEPARQHLAYSVQAMPLGRQLQLSLTS